MIFEPTSIKSLFEMQNMEPSFLLQIPEAVITFEDGEMWYLGIDQSFFPSTEGLTTYVDESPHYIKKQIKVQGPANDDCFVFEEDLDCELNAKSDEISADPETIEYGIKKIYHAQCLENHPKHFAAFVQLSSNPKSSVSEKSGGSNPLPCQILNFR